MATPARPLSPHLQIYRWQISNTLSIMHRLSGVFLGLGLVLLTAWLMAVASGPAAYFACLRGGHRGRLIGRRGLAAGHESGRIVGIRRHG